MGTHGKTKKENKTYTQKKPEARDMDWEKRLQKNERPKRPLCFPVWSLVLAPTYKTEKNLITLFTKIRKKMHLRKYFYLSYHNIKKNFSQRS